MSTPTREVFDIPFSDLLPTDPPALGPYFEARVPWHCADCGDDIEPGDWARANGYGGWLAECCGGEA